MAHTIVVEEKRYSIEEVFTMCGEKHLLDDNDFNKMRSDMDYC